MSNIDLSQLITTETKAITALERARSRASRRLMADLEAVAHTMTGDVPEAEKLSWDQKEAAAIALLADSATGEQSALLLAEAAATGEDVTALAQVIVTKAEAYRAAAGALAGIRRKYQAQIRDAASPADVPGPDDWGPELAALTAHPAP